MYVHDFWKNVQEYHEGDEQCNGDNYPLFVLVRILYLEALVGDFLPVLRTTKRILG
jgi:hypothetical protein